VASRISNVQVILNLPVSAITLRSTPSRSLCDVSFTNPFTSLFAVAGAFAVTELADGEARLLDEVLDPRCHLR
jgi:hypothetical protein